MAGFTLVDCPTRNLKETIDKKIIVDVMHFALTRVAWLRGGAETVAALCAGDARDVARAPLTRFAEAACSPVALACVHFACAFADALASRRRRASGPAGR